MSDKKQRRKDWTMFGTFRKTKYLRIENKKYEMRYVPETGRCLGKGEK
jgi:hypothetical protein